jgi:hypothetical protein
MDVQTLAMAPISGPAVWRGDELAARRDWIFHLAADQIAELEAVGARFCADDPDLRHVAAADYPLTLTAPALARWARDMDRGRGFVLVRGLRSGDYPDALSAAIFFVLGLHLGEPMRQNELGDVLDHVIATSDKTMSDPGALSSRVADRLNFHSDSSDVVALMCLRGAKSGGASSLISGATLYNTVLDRRPDLAPLFFERWWYDWRKQDPHAPANAYDSPMASDMDGVFSLYAGSSMIRSAQRYPEVPRLTAGQIALLDLMDDIFQTPGLPLDMDFQPGDIQWLLNYAALHSRTAFVDHPEPARKRHLLRLWLKRDVGRPLVANFGRHVVKGRDASRGAPVPEGVGHFRIAQVCAPRQGWGD